MSIATFLAWLSFTDDKLMLNTCRCVCTRKHRVHETCHTHASLARGRLEPHWFEVCQTSAAAAIDSINSHGCSNMYVPWSSLYVLIIIQFWKPGDQESEISFTEPTSRCQLGHAPWRHWGTMIFYLSQFKSCGLCISWLGSPFFSFKGRSTAHSALPTLVATLCSLQSCHQIFFSPHRRPKTIVPSLAPELNCICKALCAI